MNTINSIFGSGENLSALQMGARAFVMFFIMLVLIRLGGVRMFGRKSAFDDVIVIMLGAVLSRGVVGANPFWSTVAAAAVMISIHRGVAWLCIHSKKIELIVRGKATVLYKDGKMYPHNMRISGLSDSDLEESVRLEMKQQGFKNIDTAMMETNGRISFIDTKKEQQ